VTVVFNSSLVISYTVIGNWSFSLM